MPRVHSIAIFAAAAALSFQTEIVIFSPARRASRKLLERIIEFVRLLDAGDRLIEYNQEQARISTFTGGVSIIRSFPSVRALATRVIPHLLYNSTLDSWFGRKSRFCFTGSNRETPGGVGGTGHLESP